MDTIREQLIFPILVCSTLKLKLSKLLMSSRKVNLCTTLICFIGSFGSWVMSQFNKADEHRQPLRADAGSHFFIQDRREKVLYLCSSVFSIKVRIGDTIFMSLTGDGTAILRGHRPNHAKALPFAGQRQYLLFPVFQEFSRRLGWTPALLGYLCVLMSWKLCFLCCENKPRCLLVCH